MKTMLEPSMMRNFRDKETYTMLKELQVLNSSVKSPRKINKKSDVWKINIIKQMYLRPNTQVNKLICRYTVQYIITYMKKNQYLNAKSLKEYNRK